MPKATTIDALDVVCGNEIASRYAGSKKAELAGAAERIFAGNFIGEEGAKERAMGWTPEIMRFARPSKPAEAADIGSKAETDTPIAEQAA